jgi:hypothetical protein
VLGQLRSRLRRGTLRKLAVPGGPWAIWASGTERHRLGRLRRHQQSKPNQVPPEDLTTPETPKKK